MEEAPAPFLTDKQRTTIHESAKAICREAGYTGAGTVLRRDVPPGALAVSGAPQRNIDGWVQRNRAGTAAAEAASRAQQQHDHDRQKDGQDQ